MFAIQEFIPNEGEEVLYVGRKHFIYFFAKIFKYILQFIFMVSGLSLYIFYHSLIEDNLFNYNIPNYLDYLVALVSTIWFIPMLYKYLRARIDLIYDRLVVTNHRVVYINQHFIFSRDVQSVKLEDIVSVKIIITGIFQAWLDIGMLSMTVQDRDINFTGLARLVYIEKVINETRYKMTKHYNKHEEKEIINKTFEEEKEEI